MTDEPVAETLTAPIQQPAADTLPMIPAKNGGRLLTGGKPGPRKGYNKNTKNALMRELTGKLLNQISVGIASGELHDGVKAGKVRALEAATKILETVHDRAYGKPVQANHLPAGEEDGEGGVNVRVVQIGNVSITF
jgi:hypothetical protein